MYTKMPKTRPIVVYYDKILTHDISLDTPAWFQWLATQTTFSYSGHQTDMNCVKRNNGKWYANKKIFSSEIGRWRTVSLYIGTDYACTLEKLTDINEKFGLDWQRFWQWYYSKERTNHLHNGCTSNEELTLDEQLSAQADIEEEAELQPLDDLDKQLIQAKARIIELENQLAECQSQLSPLQLLQQYIIQECQGMIPVDKKGKPKPRYDQLAKFKSWLENY
jgi:hypothetical protein